MHQGIPNNLAFLLEHQYTDASLCFDGLKGHDRYALNHLRDACGEVGFSLYLASFEMSVEGGCDNDDYGGGYYSGSYSKDDYHPITEEVDRTSMLKRVVELNGEEVAKDIVYSDVGFIQEQPFDDVAPDDEDYSGYTGNEGVSATHFYHRTVSRFFNNQLIY